VFLDFLQGEFVDGEVDLEEAVGAVGVSLAEESVFEERHDGVGFVFFEESGGDCALLVATDHEGLVVAGLGVFGVQFVDDTSGFGEDFGAFDARLSERYLSVGVSLVEGEPNTMLGVVPIESVFHLVAIEVFFVVRHWQGY